MSHNQCVRMYSLLCTDLLIENVSNEFVCALGGLTAHFADTYAILDLSASLPCHTGVRPAIQHVVPSQQALSADKHVAVRVRRVQHTQTCRPASGSTHSHARGLGARLHDVRGGVADGRHGECQVDAQQRVQRALVGPGAPDVLQQVALRVGAPARRAEEAQQEVDGEGEPWCEGWGYDFNTECVVPWCLLMLVWNVQPFCCVQPVCAQCRLYKARPQPGSEDASAAGQRACARRACRAGEARRTQDDGAHAEAQDLVADLARRHLAQHRHRNRLQVERKADDAHGRAHAVCAPATRAALASARMPWPARTSARRQHVDRLHPHAVQGSRGESLWLGGQLCCSRISQRGSPLALSRVAVTKADYLRAAGWCTSRLEAC